ncbi:hypothetical protein L6164_013439 [Bauhinia variegata]|uniref:Uncharacterized protein n=1 Tax=Bauhinia variegata TaxID=167791 RepID=A0ACB9NFM3_BAUVA|nr:hypothetical protein L6164_013439 [Bauhinia variegata]
MASAAKHLQHPSSSCKPPKAPFSQNSTTITTAATSSHTNDPKPILNSTTSPITISHENVVLSCASHLTRQELLKRRSHHLKQLSRCYRDLYWALMEDLKVQYREYYWEYGVSPFKEEILEKPSEEKEGGNFEGYGDNHNSNSADFLNNQSCAFVGCKLKAMPLTSFCHLHILSDSKQKLYKACNYVIKSAQAGPITCGKPIMKSTVPSLCTVHFQKAQKHLSRTLKRSGSNISTTCKLAPKFHVVVTEYIRQIQAKRKKELRSNISKIALQDEKDS